MGGGCPGKTKNDDEVEFHKNMFHFRITVGKGGFGRVWKVQNKKTKETLALKIMSKAKILAKRSVQSVMNEKGFLINIDNDFIINMVASFQDRENLYLLMEYLSGGDLRYYINRKVKFNEEQIKFIIRCLVEGLKHLGDLNIIHRDIKPENIVFENSGYCRLTDLGVAREWRSDNSSETSGTPGYMAPEVMCKQNHSFCADYFAVGIIVFELMMGRRPYQGSSRKAIRDEILAKQVTVPENLPGFSKEMIDFVNKLIQRKVKNRLGYNGVAEVVQHPWIRMTSFEQERFRLKKVSPPFQTFKEENYDKLIIDSEPNDVERENSLLLKKDSVQEMFKEYDCHKASKQSSSFESTKVSSQNLETKSKSTASKRSISIDL